MRLTLPRASIGPSGAPVGENYPLIKWEDDFAWKRFSPETFRARYRKTIESPSLLPDDSGAFIGQMSLLCRPSEPATMSALTGSKCESALRIFFSDHTKSMTCLFGLRRS